MKLSTADDFAWAWRSIGTREQPAREYRFQPGRKWAFDFAWPVEQVAVEIDGGVYSHGRHTRGTGFIGDCDKLNAAVMLGWRVLRFTTDHLRRRPDEVLRLVAQLLADETSKARRREETGLLGRKNTLK